MADGVGHNSGIADPETMADFRARIDQFGAASKKWGQTGVANQDDAERANDFVRGAQALSKELEAERKRLKQPHDDAGKAVQKTFLPLIKVVDDAANLVKGLAEDFLRKERDRLEKERREEERRARAEAEAERERAAAAAEDGRIAEAAEAAAAADEAEAQVAAAAAPVKAQAKSASGAGKTLSLRKRRVLEVETPAKAAMSVIALDGEYLQELKVALVRIAARAARDGVVTGAPKGFRVVEKESAT